MTRKSITAGAYVAAAVLSLAVAPRSLGQAAPATEPAAGTPAASEEEIVVLSPFIVSADEAKGYAATATLASARVRTELKDVGSAISVVTPEFLSNTGATSNETLLTYTTGTEVSGVGGNMAGLGNATLLDDSAQRMAPHQSTRVRGLGQADNTRDFFITDIPWDAFNVGRVDMQRGPNAILYGIGRPAGIINSSLNGASFATQGNVEVRLGSYGSYRASFDYNKVLLDDELALRVSSLYDDTKYRQKPAFQLDERIFLSGRFDPKFLRFDGARTTIRVNYEKGDIDANRPRILPPGDLITPWWTNPILNKIRLAGGINPQTIGINDSATLASLRAAGDLAAGMRGDNSAYLYRGIGPFGRNYGGIVSVFENPDGGNSYLMYTELGKTVTQGLSLPWTILSGVQPRKDLEGAVGTTKNADFYRNETLVDRGIFDFYNKLFDGPNKKEWSQHEATNISVSQTLLDNRLGLDLSYDKQNYDRGQTNIFSEFGQSITIDMNNRLIDGSPNPNYGKAATVSDQFANNSYRSERESMRATLFGEFRFEDIMAKGKLSKILGRHVFTGLLSKDDVDTETRSWFRYAADEAYAAEYAVPELRNHTVNTLNYLTPAGIAHLANVNGAHISNLTAVQVPSSGFIRSAFYKTWTATGVQPTDPWIDQYGGTSTQAANPANYKGWGVGRYVDIYSDEEGDRDYLTTNASLTRAETESSAINWQGYFFDGTFVASYGYREDRQKSYAMPTGKNTLPKVAGLDTVDLTSPKYALPEVPDADVKGHTNTWSFVLHTPQFLRNKMPGRTGLSFFYNRSGNFQPAAGRIDVVGNSLPSPQGQTKDYGILLSTLDDKLTFKINWYETNITNDALSGFGGMYMIWGAEAWAYGFARNNLQRVAGGGWADFTKGYDPLGIVANTTPTAGWTAEQIAYAQRVGDAICNAYMATKPSADWFKLWGINTAAADAGGFIAGSEPAGLTVTGDTVSKGTEFELTAQLLPNWNITMNASKTTAKRMSMAGSLVSFIEERWKVYNTPVMLDGKQVGVIGDVRFWNGGYSPGESLKGKFGREFMSGYNLYRIQEGSNVPELRPWRFNLVTNYTFQTGFMKNINVGAAYRWQDKVVVGYPVLDGATVDDARAFDLDSPYYGPSETNIDFWVGYERKLTEKINWRIQLNIRNAFADMDLIPITVQPDGSPAVSRIPEGTTWWLSNKFSF